MNVDNYTVIIMAGGIGSRFSPTISKPLYETGNISMIQRVVDCLVSIGLKNIIVVSDKTSDVISKIEQTGFKYICLNT